jgi:hypothetical protein
MEEQSMLTKMNSQFSVLRPALLGLALMLTILAMMSPALASCTPGAWRTILVDGFCCNLPTSDATIQQQQCCAGYWENVGGPHCGPWSHCYF